MPHRLLPLGTPHEDPLPWVAPQRQPLDPPRTVALSNASAPPLPPALPAGAPLPPRPAPPPPLLRSTSHPTSRALSFALPGAATAKASPATPGLWSPRLMQQVPEPPPWTARLGSVWPRQVLPALSALPGLFGGIRQMGAALGWQALLSDRRTACLADMRTLGAGAAPWGFEVPAPMEPLRVNLRAALSREAAALTQAIWEARYKIATLALELCAIVTTVLPQLYGLSGLQVGAQTMGAMGHLLPLCMLGHGFLGVAHAAWMVWSLGHSVPDPGPADGAQSQGMWPKHCQSLHRRALRHQRLQLALWSTFTLSLGGLLTFPALAGAAAWAGGAVLALSIFGLALQHVVAGEHYDAPRALWVQPAWHSHAFATMPRHETSHRLLLEQQQLLHDGLRALTAELSPLRRALLEGLFALTSVHLAQYVFICCARAWLGHRHKELWAVIEGLQLHQHEGLCRLWAAHSWQLNRQLKRAQGAVGGTGAHAPLSAAAQGAVDRALQLTQKDLALFAHEARVLGDAIRSVRRTAYSQALRAELAQAHSPSAHAQARLGPSMLLAQKINCDEVHRALGWAGRLGHG